MAPTLSSALSLLRDRDLTNVYVEGWVDRAERIASLTRGIPVRQFVPRFNAVYFELGSLLVCASLDAATARLRFGQVSGFACEGEIDLEVERGVASIGSLVLGIERRPTRVLAVETFTAEGDAPDGLLRALGLVFFVSHRRPSERYIFVDPLNLDGIALGQREERDAWLSAAPRTKTQWIPMRNESMA